MFTSTLLVIVQQSLVLVITTATKLTAAVALYVQVQTDICSTCVPGQATEKAGAGVVVVHVRESLHLGLDRLVEFSWTHTNVQGLNPGSRLLTIHGQPVSQTYYRADVPCYRPVSLLNTSHCESLVADQRCMHHVATMSKLKLP
jgi:hypothetical protein